MVRKTAQKSDVKAMSVSKPSKAVKKPKAGDDKVKKVVKEAKKTVNVIKEVKKEVKPEKKVKAKLEVKKVEKPEKQVKAKKEVETEENVELPTIKSHPEMQELTEKTKAVEAAEQMTEGTASDQVPEVTEKVKVKRKGTLVKDSKQKESKKEGEFLSLESPAQDNKVIKVSSTGKPRRRGVVYISHIPHGFYEKQMQQFFTQFGSVTNLRLGRSRKTGRSRGFAFVEFQYMAVAKIVAETMNNYLMFNKIMKTELIPQERMSPKIFAGKINPFKAPGVVARRAAKKVQNSSTVTQEKRKEKVEKRLKKMNAQLTTAGIKYSVQIS